VQGTLPNDFSGIGQGVRLPLSARARFAYPCRMDGAMTRQFDVFARLVATRSIAECAQALAIAPAAVRGDERP